MLQAVKRHVTEETLDFARLRCLPSALEPLEEEAILDLSGRIGKRSGGRGTGEIPAKGKPEEGIQGFNCLRKGVAYLH